MKHIQELLAGRRVGMVSAHPDDHLIQIQAIAAARAAGAPVRELTLTRGRKSTINHHPDPQFVANGGRICEGESAARHLGIVSNEHLDAPDGDIASHQDELVPVVAEWAGRHGIDVLLTLGGITDHSDHIASAAIARRARVQLWNEQACAIGALETQLNGGGDWHAPTTAANQALAFGGAALHACQFLVSTEAQVGYEQTEGGWYVHTDSLRGLDQYPIRRDTSYLWLAPAVLGETVTIEPAYRQP